VTDEEDGVFGKACPQLLDVRQPLDVEAVGEEAVPVLVDLVAEEDDLLSSPSTHGLSCGDSPAEIDDRERHRRGSALAVPNRGVREDALRRPLLAEHRPDDLV
jgi:hypothetical protein